MKKTVLDAGEDCDLAHFLSRRGPHAHLVMPADVLALLRQRGGPAGWTGSATLDDIPASAKRMFVYDPQDEAGLIAAARKAKPNMGVFGVLQHVIPSLATDKTRPLWKAGSAELPQHRFAVVCTPRTGSTFLCELLQAGGLGAPKEHLRAPLVHVLHADHVNHEQIYELVMQQGTVDGVFGTKIISHFLFDAFGEENAADRLQCLADRGFKFVRLRRDEVEQALSKYVSKHSGVWHERGEVSAKAQERMAKVGYDFDELCETYDKARREDRALDAAMAQLAPELVLEQRYDSVVAEPLKALSACAQFLGLPAKLDAVNFDELPTKLSAGVDQTQLLRQRFEADLAQR